MIVVKIELWPFGDESRAREIGRAEIWNDGSGSITTGNYHAKLLKSPKYATSKGVWKKGRVENFPRLKLGPYDLLLQILESAIGKRNGIGKLSANKDKN
jgi:hypothetical protein